MPTVRPNSDVTTTGWTPSTGGSVYATIDESAYDDADYSLSPVSGLTPLVLGLDATVAAGTHRIPVRLSVATGTQDVVVRLLNGSGVEQGVSAAQTVTTTPTTYTFVVTTTGAATRVEVDMAALSATITWQAPTLDGDNAAIADIASYKVYWGQTSGGPYTANSGAISSPTTTTSWLGVTTYTYTTPANLTAGTWYFVITTTDSDGNESDYSYETGIAVA